MALAVLVALTAATNPAFLTLVNIINILNTNAMLGIIAVGMTLVIILGGIDLSVGSLMAFAAGLGAMALAAIAGEGAGNEWLAVAAGFGVASAIGLAGGWLNGALIAWGRLAPFIATLAGLVAYRSAITWMADGGHISARGTALLETIGRGIQIPFTEGIRTGGVHLPVAIIAFFAIAGAGMILLNLTRLGRHIVAIGSNEQAARYSAINVEWVKFTTYGIIGLLSGVAAFFYIARFESVNSGSAGQLLELEVIAAVVIGGTRMQGGSGSITGTVIGVLLIGVIRNTLVLQNVNTYAHGLVMGSIIIVAVLLQQLATRR
ncbi:MAG: ABC transporter permease [Phycisphaeraceae bacterium]|nr:ABC transporter permease [Phycisphaeraceae bacterium]